MANIEVAGLSKEEIEEHEEGLKLLAEAYQNVHLKLWPSRIQEFYEVALNEIEKSGLDQGEKGKALAASICTAISLYMGGKSFYLPASSGLKQAIQDLRIAKDFTGFNYPELAKKYRVSEMTIRTSLKRQKALMTEVRKGGR
ncbi:hypothetical protein THMIRHAS_12400 [Thiosulfatimonas sediminis]|uniref:Mor transcription activator domain-containing protein n=1 Tax=Thiosulfatimonas sediminis TaxID=2675054 RepID=A0A6F8PV06_9GAMM|nr:Mor transcription activator family protein [Thiosulfatimonas sediminis]BBP45867.1 hypothetical protein THMIRHAS_12400 [Thiosulfatimonas sediminis]